MPTELINAVGVSSVRVLLVESVVVQVEDGDGLVERAGSQPLAIATPIDGVNFRAVRKFNHSILMKLAEKADYFNKTQTNICICKRAELFWYSR